MRWAIAFSVFLHGLALVAFRLAPRNGLEHARRGSTSIRTRVLSENDFLKELKTKAIAVRPAKKLQLVQVDDQLKSSAPPLEDEAVFLGRHNQRVDRNTRAARVGAFKNVLKEGTRDARDLFKLAGQAKAPSDDSFIDSPSAPTRQPASIAEPVRDRGKTTRFPASDADHKIGEGFSATDDYLPDVAVGANTLLNSREYKYASFFERIREKLSHEWQHRLRAEIDGLSARGLDQIRGERTTQLRVTLDARGTVVHIETAGSAGYVEFDRAAVEAFNASGPFQNPPAELLVEAGLTLSIDWHFVVIGTPESGLRTRVERGPAGFR